MYVCVFVQRSQVHVIYEILAQAMYLSKGEDIKPHPTVDVACCSMEFHNVCLFIISMFKEDCGVSMTVTGCSCLEYSQSVLWKAILLITSRHPLMVP